MTLSPSVLQFIALNPETIVTQQEEQTRITTEEEIIYMLYGKKEGEVILKRLKNLKF